MIPAPQDYKEDSKSVDSSSNCKTKLRLRNVKEYTSVIFKILQTRFIGNKS